MSWGFESAILRRRTAAECNAPDGTQAERNQPAQRRRDQRAQQHGVQLAAESLAQRGGIGHEIAQMQRVAQRDGGDILYGDAEQEIKTSVKIFNNTVTLTRNGETQSRIVITPGQRQACVYETPYGSFVFGFTGEKLRHRFTEQGGELFVRYRVDTEKQPLQTNEITLKVRKCEP